MIFTTEELGRLESIMEKLDAAMDRKERGANAMVRTAIREGRKITVGEIMQRCPGISRATARSAISMKGVEG